ncbi:MAG: hypothetical protein PGN13_02090 [Patulibacter minatonensis]
MTDPRTNTSNPWWAEVEHLRTSPETGRHQTLQPSQARRQERHTAPAAAGRAHAERARNATPATGRRRSAERTDNRRPDWFAQEARDAGRRTTPAPVEPQRPARPRVTLVDVAPAHTLVRRAPQTRRRAGERPTVTITGRPDAALPPRPTENVPTIRGARTRERATSLVASPDRMILWAVALGILMIVASIATSAGA